MRDAFPDAEVFCVSLDALGGVGGGVQQDDRDDDDEDDDDDSG